MTHSVPSSLAGLSQVAAIAAGGGYSVALTSPTVMGLRPIQNKGSMIPRQFRPWFIAPPGFRNGIYDLRGSLIQEPSRTLK